MPNKTRILMIIYDMVLQWQGKEDVFLFISDECGVTNRAFRQCRQTVFSLPSSFIYLLRHVTCYSYMYHVTETSFSVSYF